MTSNDLVTGGHGDRYDYRYFYITYVACPESKVSDALVPEGNVFWRRWNYRRVRSRFTVIERPFNHNVINLQVFNTRLKRDRRSLIPSSVNIARAVVRFFDAKGMDRLTDISYAVVWGVRRGLYRRLERSKTVHRSARRTNKSGKPSISDGISAKVERAKIDVIDCRGTVRYWSSTFPKISSESLRQTSAGNADG